MKKPKKLETKTPEEPAKEIHFPRKIFYIEKISMRLYHLMQLQLDDMGQVELVELVAADLPAIIYAKYLREIKNQAFSK